MFSNRFSKLACAAAAASAISVGALFPAVANAESVQNIADHSQVVSQQGEITYYDLNEYQVGVSSSDYSFSVDEDGSATVTSLITGETEELPSETVDNVGKKVRLEYEETPDEGLVITAIDHNGRVKRGAAKCASSIVGGAGSAAVAGGLAGVGAGTVTLPVVGTVGGGLVGVVGGGIFGGIAGAGAGCFN